MFKGHPKGLFVAFFANMGERFGFYTMVTIFVLFMQAKYGMSAAAAGSIYATFMVGVYIFPLLGGFLADRFLGYGRTISLGIVVMFIGYILLALPTTMNTGFPLIVAALAVIAWARACSRATSRPSSAISTTIPSTRHARPGLQHFLHGHQHRGHVRSVGFRGRLQLDHGQVPLRLRRPHPGPGQRLPQGQAGRRLVVPVDRPGPGRRP